MCPPPRPESWGRPRVTCCVAEEPGLVRRWGLCGGLLGGTGSGATVLMSPVNEVNYRERTRPLVSGLSWHSGLCVTAPVAFPPCPALCPQ